MIKLDIEVSPAVCNLLLASLAASMQGIEALMKQVAEQGNAQMQPPQPQPQAEQPAAPAQPEQPTQPKRVRK